MLSWAFEAFDFMLFSVLAIPIMTTLNIDRIAFGLAISAGLIGTIIGGIGSGITADKFGRVKVLMASLLIRGAATIGIALSRTFYELLLFRFIVGPGECSPSRCSLSVHSIHVNMATSRNQENRASVSALQYLLDLWTKKSITVYYYQTLLKFS
ncbi:MAG: hypothetical protein DRJ52_01990 [Thermoprotei archaeon]|nr:MAG: hypothetical protein DRJ52_01990 [Thermoprotei archaeon]